MGTFGITPRPIRPLLRIYEGINYTLLPHLGVRKSKKWKNMSLSSIIFTFQRRHQQMVYHFVAFLLSKVLLQFHGQSLIPFCLLLQLYWKKLYKINAFIHVIFPLTCHKKFQNDWKFTVQLRNLAKVSSWANLGWL